MSFVHLNIDMEIISSQILEINYAVGEECFRDVTVSNPIYGLVSMVLFTIVIKVAEYDCANVNDDNICSDHFGCSYEFERTVELIWHTQTRGNYGEVLWQYALLILHIVVRFLIMSILLKISLKMSISVIMEMKNSTSISSFGEGNLCRFIHCCELDWS